MKSTLLKEFSPPASVRVSRLLDLPRQHIGDRTQTHVWHKIATLRQLPETDETTKQYKHLDLYKEIWLQCLSWGVRSALHNTEGSIEELNIERTDKLTIALKAANLIIIPLSNTIWKSRQQPPPLDNGDKNLRNIIDCICGYHCRSSSHARRCMHGCKHFTAKNAEGGRK